MKVEHDAVLARIFVGEDDGWEGRPLYMAIVERLRKEGVAGASVFRGIEGFGVHARLHSAHFGHMHDNLPIVLEVVDSAEKIEAMLPWLDEMVGEGTITVERVRAVTYRRR